MRFYIDTSIWIDFIEDRKGFYGEPLGEYAFKLLMRIKERGDSIVLSDFVIKELNTHCSDDLLMGTMNFFENIIEKIFLITNQKEEAKKIALINDVPYGDAVHAILARDYSCILITRDNHFRKLDSIAQHFKPEELI